MDPTLLSTLVQGGFAALAIYLVWDTRQESRARDVQARAREESILRDALAREARLVAEAQTREDRLMSLLDQYSRRLDDVVRALGCVQTEVAALGALMRGEDHARG